VLLEKDPAHRLQNPAIGSDVFARTSQPLPPKRFDHQLLEKDGVLRNRTELIR
jgi:hypothetical protein